MIKKYTHFNENNNTSEEDAIRERYSIANKFSDRLQTGLAICVFKKDINDFFETMEIIEWIILPSSNSRELYSNEKYYFVLFGDRLLHTDRPFFGGFELEVYTPSTVK